MLIILQCNPALYASLHIFIYSTETICSVSISQAVTKDAQYTEKYNDQCECFEHISCPFEELEEIIKTTYNSCIQSTAAHSNISVRNDIDQLLSERETLIEKLDQIKVPMDLSK